MKKTITLLSLVFFAGSVFAQTSIDVSVEEILSPTELNSTPQNNTPLPFKAVVMNNSSTETINAGDSLLWYIGVIDLATSQIIVEAPQGGGQNRYIRVLTDPIAPGDTQHLSGALNINAGLTYSRDVRVGMIISKANNDDPSTSNNANFIDIVWYNQQGWGVSIEEVDFHNNLKVYPVPADQDLQVELLLSSFDDVKIELFDLTGKAVVSENQPRAIYDNHYTISTAELENGIYLLKVTQGDQISTVKVAVTH